MNGPQRYRLLVVRLILMPRRGCIVVRWFVDRMIENIAHGYAEDALSELPAAQKGLRFAQRGLKMDRLVDLGLARHGTAFLRPADINRIGSNRVESIEERVEQGSDARYVLGRREGFDPKKSVRLEARFLGKVWVCGH